MRPGSITISLPKRQRKPSSARRGSSSDATRREAVAEGEVNKITFTTDAPAAAREIGILYPLLTVTPVHAHTCPAHTLAITPCSARKCSARAEGEEGSALYSSSTSGPRIVHRVVWVFGADVARALAHIIQIALLRLRLLPQPKAGGGLVDVATVRVVDRWLEELRELRWPRKRGERQ